MRLAAGAGAAVTVTARLVAARDVQALLGVVEDTLDLNFAHVCAALRRLALLKRCVLPAPPVLLCHTTRACSNRAHGCLLTALLTAC
jgi:hypothetical protein